MVRAGEAHAYRGKREEDNEKRERLKILHAVIGLPFDEPVQFSALDIANASSVFLTFLNEHGAEYCALRLIPLDPSLPKLRLRGKTVKEAVGWFHEQVIPPIQYRVDFMPHSEHTLWSTIFIVNSQGIFGEFAWGAHNQLTQGYYERKGEPNIFSYDWTRWSLARPDHEAQKALEDSIVLLKVEDPQLQACLQRSLHAGLIIFFVDISRR